MWFMLYKAISTVPFGNGNIIMGLLYKTYVFYLIAVEECFTSILQVKSIYYKHWYLDYSGYCLAKKLGHCAFLTIF